MKSTSVAEQELDVIYFFDLGKKHAQKWLKNPQGKPLALLRLEFSQTLIDANKRELNSQNIQTPEDITAATMEVLEISSAYSAGVDQVLGEFLVQAMAEPTGSYQ